MNTDALEELLENGSLWSGGKACRSPSVRGRGESVSFGVPEIDSALAFGGLERGAVHEFCCEGSLEVPMGMLAALAVQSSREGRYTIWVGRQCRPDPVFIRNLLPRSKAEDFLSHSLFIDPPDQKKILWSVEAALRSPAVSAVTAFLNNISFPLSRRLSLSAKNAQTLGLFAVPPAALLAPTAASTVWQVRPAVSPSLYPRFELSLLKQKGGPVPAAPWVCELVDDGEKISFNIPADVVGESGTAKADEHPEEKIDRFCRRA